MSVPVSIPSQKRKGGRAPLPEVEENFTRLPPGPGDRTERAVCKHCGKERSWHTTELVKHLDKCAQYTPSKRQKYTRPWRIEKPVDSSPSQQQPSRQSPQQTPDGDVNIVNRNVRLGPPPGLFQWDGGLITERPTTNINGRSPEIQHRQNGIEDGEQRSRPHPPNNHHILHTPSHSVVANADYTSTPPFAHRASLPSQPPSRPLACPSPVTDPDQRLHGFIEYERGAMAWQSRPEDLDAIEAWLQYHRVDVEDIKEISENRWCDSWQLKLGDLYRIRRDVQTFKIFAAR